MSLKMGWFGVHADRERTLQALQAATNDAPRDAFPSRWGVASEGDWTSVSIQGWEFGHAFDWAQAVSRHIGDSEKTVIAFFVLEGTWSWSLFIGGQNVAAMEAYACPHPTLMGDLPRAARALNVEESFLRSYCVGHPFGDVDEEEISDDEFARIHQAMEKLELFRAQEGDDLPPWDEWCHETFADRIGLPPPGSGDEIGIEGPEVKQEAWDQQRLDPAKDSVFTFDPNGWREEHS